ncbi:MAG: PorT family protein [Bacteroidales bacterium]|nr:PorT family protein [Bacteroidales bacterium]
MKKISLIFLTVILLSPINAKASEREREWRIGVAAGFDMADVRVASQDLVTSGGTYMSMPSFNLNGYLGYRNGRFLGLSMEPGFIRKGAQRNSDYRYNYIDTKYEMNYFHMPVLVDLYLTKRLSVSAGPELGYLFSAYVKTVDGRFDCIQLYTNRFEVSGLFGVQYSLFKWFDVGLRYNRGLMYTSATTQTNDIGDILGEEREYNQYWQLMLRIKI